MEDSHASLFDYSIGQKLKLEGIEKASSFPFDEPIHRARLIAIMLAKKNGETHADEVYEYLSAKLPEVLAQIPPNGWGSVFRHPRLKFTGRVRQSAKVSRHTGIQRIWTYAA